MKKNIRAITAVLCLMLTLILSLSACSLFTRIVDDLVDELNQENTDFVYGSVNKLAVGFNNRNLTAFWDAYDGYDEYKLVVDDDGAEKSYTGIGATSVDLEQDYDYSDNLLLTLYGVDDGGEEDAFDELCKIDYSGVSRTNYTKYTPNISGGWIDLDRYAATREELFELFSYLIIFRPNSGTSTSEGKTYYTANIEMAIGYDYEAYYADGVSEDKAFESEIKSAVDAYEDSAGYSYTYTFDKTSKVCSVNIKFVYSPYPSKTTTSSAMYDNATGSGLFNDHDRAHYTEGTVHTRSFPIDSITKTVSVSSSDQLYFAIKKGYKPAPVAGSNAEYLYNYMRGILAQINTDSTSATNKAHYIYDYMVNTVVYDYVYVNDTLETEDNGVAFSYKCLYLEGVFGFENDKTFKKAKCSAICDGIAKAFLCMATIEGIPTVKVSGTASGVSHAWNKAYVNNKWYLVDVTWGNELVSNSKTEFLNHKYLLVADDSLHKEDSWYSYPKAKSKLVSTAW